METGDQAGEGHTETECGLQSWTIAWRMEWTFKGWRTYSKYTDKTDTGCSLCQWTLISV